jgi:hypothetical protein
METGDKIAESRRPASAAAAHRVEVISPLLPSPAMAVKVMDFYECRVRIELVSREPKLAL